MSDYNALFVHLLRLASLEESPGRGYVTRRELAEALANLPPIDRDRFFADADVD